MLSVLVFWIFDGFPSKWQSTPVLLPGKSHGQGSLVGHSPWGHKESDTTERLHLFLFTYYKTFPFQSLILFFLLKKNVLLLSEIPSNHPLCVYYWVYTHICSFCRKSENHQLLCEDFPQLSTLIRRVTPSLGTCIVLQHPVEWSIFNSLLLWPIVNNQEQRTCFAITSLTPGICLTNRCSMYFLST